MTSAREINDLIAQIDATPYGAEERQLLRQALDKAAELDDPDLEYRLRMRQTSSAFMSGDTETMLTAFPLCLGKHDSNPARFPYKVDNEDLLWQFKWMAEVLLVNPRFSLNQADAMIADMQRRYEAAGVGLSGVWQARFSNALETGRMDDAATFRAQRDAAGEDDYSHCDACVRSEDVLYFREAGNHDRALALFDEIIEGGFTCGEEPERAQGHVLLLLLAAGRPEDAEFHHRQGLRFAQHSAEPLPLVLPHLPFLAVTGNLAKGLSLMEQYLPSWADDAIDLRVRFQAACSFAVILDALTADGHGSVLVRNSHHPDLVSLLGDHDGLWSASDLAAACWRIADDLAAQFDERNGTQRFAGLVRDARALADMHYDLPLGGPVPLDLDIPAPAPKTAEDYLASAALKTRLGDDQLSALDDLATALTLADPGQRVRVSRDIAVISAELDLPTRHEAIDDLVAALRQAGRDAEAQMYAQAGADLLLGALGLDLDAWRNHDDERARGLALSYQLRQHLIAEDLDAADQTYAELVALDHPDLAGSHAAATMAMLHLELQRDPDTAVQLATSLADHAQPWVAYLANVRLAQHHGGSGEFAAGLAPAERALTIAVSFGNRPLTANAAALSASLLADEGRLDEAINRQRLAIRQTQLSELPGETQYRFQLGRYLLDAGRNAEAADEFDDVARAEAASDESPESRAFTFFYQALASRDIEPGRAYHSFKQAAELASSGSDAELRARIGLSFGQFLMNFEDEDAVEILASALDEAADAGLDGPTAMLRHWLGRARCAFGDSAGLDDLDEALRLETASGNAWAVADITDSTGRALVQLGRLDEGIAKLLGAADAYAAADDANMAAGSEIFVARALRQAGRDEDALVAYEASRDRLRDEPGPRATVSAEFADYLDELGQHDRARSVRD